MSITPKISVVIGCYNQKEALGRVLSGFSLQTVNDFEVIVVDSSSTDGTDRLLASWSPRYLFHYLIQENSGKTGARNKAVAMATSPLLLITDADMIPDPNLIETHLAAHASSKVPTCFEGSTWNMHVLAWPSEPENLYPYIREKLRAGAKLGWHYFLTGNLSLPVALFRQFKGFDMDFQGYGWEDIELGYRLSKAKVPLRYLPAAKNYHYHVVGDDDFIRREVKKGESAAVFLKKHPELKWFLGLNPLALWVATHTDESSWLYRFATRCYTSGYPTRQRFGRWLLGEYHYREGLLRTLAVLNKDV
jgi:glycosyltransferase involved in cell wall biosynthesis